MAVATLANGLVSIAVPLELRQLHATPTQTGVALSMFGFGMFAFEWVWGLLADRLGYRIPLIASSVLYAVGLIFLARAGSVVQIAIAYFLATGMMVAAGPLGRSFIGTTMPPRLRAAGLAMISAMWVFAAAVGAGAGGHLIERFSITPVLYVAAVLPLICAVLLGFVFRGYRETRGIWSDPEAAPQAVRAGAGFKRVLLVTAAIVLLLEIGAGGETALLPLLVTERLHLSAADAGTALLLLGIFTGLLLVPGGIAADRLGRRPVMVAGAVISAAGFGAYVVAGSLTVIILGTALRALGSAMVWPAATAMIAEAAPHRRHALVMGLYGEFENFGVTLGPVIGGLVWAAFGIQAAFLAYAGASIATAVVAAVAVAGGTASGKILVREEIHDRQPDRV
jgi:MFS family permease